MDLFEKVPDHLKCPICLEMHGDKVFQCKNGHVLCKSCYIRPEMHRCPSCRTPLDLDGIPNRYLEECLETLRIDCPFSEAGCDAKLDRKSIQAHAQKCPFINVRSSINLCKILGYPDCDFMIKRENTAEAIRHFKSAHSFVLREGGSTLTLEYANCDELGPRVSSSGPESHKNIIMPGSFVGKPVIVELTKEQIPFLIIPVFDTKDGSISWTPISFPTRSHDRMPELRTQIEFAISAKRAGTEMELLNMSISPIDIFKADTFLQNCRLFSIIPTSEGIKGGSLILKMKVKKSLADEAEVPNGRLNFFVMASSRIPWVQPDHLQSEASPLSTVEAQSDIQPSTSRGRIHPANPPGLRSTASILRRFPPQLPPPASAFAITRNLHPRTPAPERSARRGVLHNGVIIY